MRSSMAPGTSEEQILVTLVSVINIPLYTFAFQVDTFSVLLVVWYRIVPTDVTFFRDWRSAVRAVDFQFVIHTESTRLHLSVVEI